MVTGCIVNQLGIIHPRLTQSLYPYKLFFTSIGRIYTRIAGGNDGYGVPTVAYQASDAVPCGFEPISAEKMDVSRVGVVDGKARFLQGTAIKEHDYFLLTSRYNQPVTGMAIINGSSVTGQLYRVVGPPVEGAAGVQVELKFVSEAVTL